MATLKQTTVTDTGGVKFATGTGAQNSAGTATVVSFTTVGTTTWTVPTGIKTVEVLVIGAGGGGANSLGGGGGAGGYIEAKQYPVTPGGTVSVTVGEGGPGGPTNPSGYTPGNTGGVSVFGNLRALGGGAGAGYASGQAGTGNPAFTPIGAGSAQVNQNHGFSGGSGGGGGGTESQIITNGGQAMQLASPYAGAVGWGYPGGAGWGGGSANHAGGGGGGAGGRGGDNTGIQSQTFSVPASGGGDGGPGRASDITGSWVVRGGGGGGGSHGGTQTGGAGGAGGGGKGGNHSPQSAGVAGTANTGGGGGAGYWPWAPGGPGGLAGGPGVVIVKYVTDDATSRPQVGAIRWNSTLSRHDVFNGTNWVSSGAKTVVSFTATGPGTWTVPTGVGEVEVLVVAGGGGSAGIGGGGGGGGIVYNSHFPVTPAGTVSYSVGAGGASGGTYPGPAGSTGTPSVFGSHTAVGGGGAGSWNSNAPNPGGSGAGGPGTPGAGVNGGSAAQLIQSNPGGSNFGNPGARGGYNGPYGSDGGVYFGSGQYTAGGGGGAGRAGGMRGYVQGGMLSPVGDSPAGYLYPQYNANDTRFINAGRQGGDGMAFDISGTITYYGGGGGGGAHTPGFSPVVSAQGGQGGGGRGSSYDYQYSPAPAVGAGEPGATNTGGGAGGGYYSGTTTGGGGSGGPGIIIIRY